MKTVIKSVGHINPDPQNLLKAFEENRETILTPDMREHIRTLRQTCKHLGIQGRAFSDAWLPDHVLWILIETMRPHLERKAKADAFNEALIRVAVLLGFEDDIEAIHNPYTEES